MHIFQLSNLDISIWINAFISPPPNYFLLIAKAFLLKKILSSKKCYYAELEINKFIIQLSSLDFFQTVFCISCCICMLSSVSVVTCQDVADMHRFIKIFRKYFRKCAERNKILTARSYSLSLAPVYPCQKCMCYILCKTYCIYCTYLLIGCPIASGSP